MSLVSLVKISKDATFPMKQAISQALNCINYRFDKKIRKVVIKPNLCYYWDSSTGQTTEPQFVAELIDYLREEINPDIDIAIVESDASAMRCKYAFRMLGYEDIAAAENVRLVNLSEDEYDSVDVPCDGNVYNFKVPKTISDADLRINIAHIKYTVSPIKLTCAMKNIFGCNPNPKKFKYHIDLGHVIVALNKAMKFDLHIIDNNIAAGVAPRRMGLVMASQDPVALDTAAAKIAWLNPDKIPYFQLAEQEGLGKRDYIPCGEPLSTFKAVYPKPNYSMKSKDNALKILVGVGLGKRLGLE